MVQNHESEKNNEESGPGPRNHFADLATLHAQDPGYREGGPFLRKLLVHFEYFSSLKAIETLLDKEYIERVDGSKDTFTYIS